MHSVTPSVITALLLLGHCLCSLAMRRKRSVRNKAPLDVLHSNSSDGEIACWGPAPKPKNKVFPNGDVPKRFECADGKWYGKTKGEEWCSCKAFEAVDEYFTILRKTDCTPMQSQNCEESIGPSIRNARNADLDPILNDGPLYDNGKFAMKATRRYVLFLYPKHDNVGAFGFRDNSMLSSRLDCWRARGFAAVMRVVGSTREAMNVLALFPDRSIYHVVLGGHGNPVSLCWGRAHHCLISRAPRSSIFLELLRTKLTGTAGVTLDACSNAEQKWYNKAGWKNLFSFVASKLPGHAVTASKIVLEDSHFHTLDDDKCLAGDNLIFKNDGEDISAKAETWPNCKELLVSEIAGFAHGSGACLSRCRKSCADMQKAWDKDSGKKKFKLTDAGPQDKQFNPCSVLGKGKRVCNIFTKLSSSIK